MSTADAGTDATGVDPVDGPERGTAAGRARDAGPEVVLRAVSEEDIPVFYEHQLEPDAVRLAAFPPRGREEHLAHWRDRIIGDDRVAARTVLVDGQVAGNVVSWEHEGRRLVGYWIGKEFWGKGVATEALSAFLREVERRPLHAHVSTQNPGSIRVLEKCGFTPIGSSMDGEIEELIFQLRT